MNYWIHDFMKPCRRDQTPHIAMAPRSGSCRDSDAKQSRGEKRILLLVRLNYLPISLRA